MKPSTFASWRLTGSAPCSNRGMSTSSPPIRLAREGAMDRAVTVTAIRTDHSGLVTKRLNVFERT